MMSGLLKWAKLARGSQVEGVYGCQARKMKTRFLGITF